MLNLVSLELRSMDVSERIGRRRAPGRPGRPSKGPRYARTIRFPEPLNDVIEVAATEAGYDNLNDFVVDVLYKAHAAGLFPTAAPGQAQQLPISA
ncbi:MAG: hypothetical protein ACRDOH_27095 [Streptosporangiaceae bacterium]